MRWLFLSMNLLVLLGFAVQASSYTKPQANSHRQHVQDEVKPSTIDFIHFDAKLTPDFLNQSLSGTVKINFVPTSTALSSVQFSAKYKTISAVYLDGNEVAYEIDNEQLNVHFSKVLKPNRHYQLEFEYTAKPKRGMKFYDDHLFTVYHTQNWLIAHANISDKATFDLSLVHQAQYKSAGNGRLISSQKLNQTHMLSHWRQSTPVPIYTFGFALGEFSALNLDVNGAQIDVLYRDEDKSLISPTQIAQAFADTGDMHQFFQDKAGFELPLKQYRYVLVNGYMAQEASGFSLVGEKFVHTLLSNKHENWFIAHELAHEWWGNSVTSANFSHFWLNEGLVVFLVAAYKQHLFGDEAYENEINVAIRRVARAVTENRIAPVAFRHEIEEKNLNRTMSYSKGALVFYMLREKLGDKVFWQALKQYTLSHKDNSVTTQDLKHVFEQASNTDLTDFFAKWVYGAAIPSIELKLVE